MADTNKYTVSYFSAENPEKFAAALASVGQRELLAPSEDSVFFLRRLHKTAYPFSLNKLRFDNLPKKADKKTKTERDLQLAEDEGLIEKLYFVFDEESGQLVLQQNPSVCYANSVAKTLTSILHVSASSLAPQLGERELIDGDAVYSLNLAFATTGQKPKSGDILALALNRLLSDVGNLQHAKVTLQISSVNKENRAWVAVDKIRKLAGFSGFDWKRCRVRAYNENEGDVLVDLFKMAKTDKIEVKMNGRYPDESDIIAQLKSCL